MGLALSEDFEDLKKHTNMIACGMPYIKDVPDDISANYLQTPRAQGPRRLRLRRDSANVTARRHHQRHLSRLWRTCAKASRRRINTATGWTAPWLIRALAMETQKAG